MLVGLVVGAEIDQRDRRRTVSEPPHRAKLDELGLAWVADQLEA
ncbi:MAG TPA: hypothetical protein VI701_06055 [Anaerolineales bacterium]|nr:hypothetical protein [Anaerolineales bacterium]